MKRLYCLLTVAWLWYALPLFAQAAVPSSVIVDPTSDTLRKKLDLVFAPIDKSQVPTSWLEQYGTPLIPLDLFNNTLTDSSRTNAQVFRFLYGTLYSSRIYGGNPMPTLATVNSRIKAIEQTYPNAIPIAVMRWDYATLRPDAVSANLLRVQNDQLYDVAGRTQSPYLTKTVFAAAPTRSYSNSGTVSFIFHQNVTFSSGATLTLTNLYIDLGNGQGYKGIGWGTPITASYTTKGTKRIKVKFRYSTGLEMESHFDVEVLNAACPTCRYWDSSPPPQIFQAVAGSHSGGTVHIRYGGGHTQLTRPLIVAEGYDGHFAAPDVYKENYSIANFMAGITTAGAFDFNNALDNVGNYDIVFIDYNNGTDDIRRNAALFREVVAWVNGNKVGSEQNVVMGLSMGGLVARYGLAQMVKAGQNPQTRLLITHDSPHKGANTPLGAQALTRQSIINIFGFATTADLSPALDQANRLLDELASQQMLILRATDANGGVASNAFLGGEYRSMITFTGGPQPAYRTIATSLGSQCGNGSLAPYAELVRSSGEAYLSLIPWIKRRSLKVDIIVNALPQSGPSQRISYLRVYVQYRILSFINITINAINKSYSSPANTLPWDGLSGGTQNVADQAGSEIPSRNNGFPPFLKLSLQTQLAGDFCFVPTVSALDIVDINSTTASGIYVGGIPSVSSTPVNTFIAQERFTLNGVNKFNQVHIEFTARNSEWMFNEMQQAGDRTLNCSTECVHPGLSIVGSEPLCTSTTFSVSNGMSVRWSSSNTTGVVINPTTGVATRQGSFTGTVVLTAVVNGTCPTLTRTIQVGMGEITGTYTNNGQQYLLYDGQGVRVGITNVSVTTPGASSAYTWLLQSGNPASWYSTGNSLTLNLNANQGASFKVSTTNSCGPISRLITFYSTGTAFKYTASPNPSDKYLEVHPQISANDDQAIEAFQTLNDAQNTAKPNLFGSDVSAKLYNRFSQIVWSSETNQNAFRIDTSKLPADTYFLHITQDGKTTKQQIVVRH